MLCQRTIAAVLLAALVAPLAPQEAAAWGGGEVDPGDPQQWDFWGFSIAPEPQALGQELRIVGVVSENTTWLPIPLSFAFNEYTVYISGAILSQRIPNGPLVQSTYSGGYADFYADPSFNAPFHSRTDPSQVPPLNPAQVPANFIDGDLVCRMAFRNLITLFYAPAGIGSVAYTASELRATGGTALGILQQHHMVIGWHMGGGYTNDPSARIPAGYAMRYDPLIRWENPLPVEPATWGGIKAAFR